MITEIFCVHCGEKCVARIKSDGSTLKECKMCGGNPLPIDVLMVNLDIGEEDIFVCSSCNKLHTGNSFCWSCGKSQKV